MAIEFECPDCETTIRVKDSAAGKTGRCPKCRVLLLVPDPDDWEDEEPDETQQAPDVGEPTSTPIPPTPEPPADIRHTEYEKSVPSPPEPPFPDPTPPNPESTFGDTRNESNAAEDNPSLSIDTTSQQETFPPIVDTSPTPSPTPAPPQQKHLTPEPATPPASHVDPSSLDFSSTESPVESVIRRRSRSGNSGFSRKTKIAISSALVGFVVLVGLGTWFYVQSLPVLSGPLVGDRLSDATFAEVTAPIPSDISEADRSKVLSDLETNGLPISSEYVRVNIYGSPNRLELAIAPGPNAVTVRVPVADLPGVKEVMNHVEKTIMRHKRNRLKQATVDFVDDYIHLIDSGTPIKRLLEFRDEIALNSSVKATGYAIQAVVGSTPFLCAYEDGAGNCYFFLPQKTDHFRLTGRSLTNNPNDIPLPLDFDVTLKQVDDEVSVDASGDEPTDTSGEEKETSEDSDAKPQSADKAAEKKEGNTTDEAKNGQTDEDESAPGETESKGDLMTKETTAE